MKLHLVDISKPLVEAWKVHFEPFPEVSIHHCDMFSVAEYCIVSPANSHGFMDGGIDLHYRNFFGSKIETIVQDAIQRRPEGLLPVGAALAVRTGDDRIPYLIVAPTMEMPEAVPPHHCSRALRAVFRVLDQSPEIDGHIFCPGLATLTGRVNPNDAAEHMAEAYFEWKSHTETDS